MKTRVVLPFAPKPAVDVFELEILLSLILQVLNIIDRFFNLFGISFRT
ncbi:MAG: hypothetical protein ACLFTT_07270 [Candidatus Hydrogenedentota bacterium]